MPPSINAFSAPSLNKTFETDTKPTPISQQIDASGIVINVVFGLLAVSIGVVTIWQAHRAYRMWHNHRYPQTSFEISTIVTPSNPFDTESVQSNQSQSRTNDEQQTVKASNTAT